MKAIVIGGFGRSGTSLIRDWMVASKRAISFGSAESKFFVEPYGLIDLFRAYCSDFSYSRATLAAREFRILMTKQLTDRAFFNQPPITDRIVEGREDDYSDVIDGFLKSLDDEDVPVWHSPDEFWGKVRHFVHTLLGLYADGPLGEYCFVEKTPHNCLNPQLFTKIFDPLFLVWVLRDPRAVAYSTYTQNWGPTSVSGAAIYTKQTIQRYLAMRDVYGGYEIRLEDLVERQEDVVQGLASYCSAAVQPWVKPFKADVLDRWKAEIAPVERDLIEEMLAPEVARLGY